MAGTRLRNRGLLWLFAAGLMPAQYPGQYPPGQYPPDQYPGGQSGGAGIPMPRFPGRKKKPGDKKPSDKEVLQQFTGKIDKVSTDSLAIAAPDTRMLTFKCTKITKYFKGKDEIAQSDFKAGDEVGIEARKDDEGYFYAVNVKLVKAAPAPEAAAKDTKEAKEATEQPAEKPAGDDSAEPPRQATVIQNPSVFHDPDDEGPPTLRRGKPAPRPRKTPEEEEPPAPPTVAAVASHRVEPEEPGEAPAPAPPKPPAPLTEAAFVEKARETATQFSESLPNYICQQMTTRYQGEGHPVNWQPLDVVSAAVVYEGGKESYRDIKINNKAVNKPMDQIPGSWSYGEFGTTLRDLFSPATAAEFIHRRDTTASGVPAVVYDFHVEQPNSHWQTIMGGQSVMPAYHGSVWIDKKNFRVLRIEMQARSVPQEFPLDTIEWVVEYSYVRIGMTPFLLPVHGENLSCWRGSTQCVRNALDFRNYRKFVGESQIMTTDSNISFEGDETPKETPAAKPKKK